MTETFIDISLLLPTRGRPKLASRLFESLAATTTDLDKLELVLYLDDDDVDSHAVTHPALQIVRLILPGNQTMGRMNQTCYDACRGRFVMLMNDDVVFRTEGWDRRIIETFDRFADGIALVYGNDLYQRASLPTMPILSRYCCELMSGICPLSYRNTYIDLHIFDLFKKLAKLGYARIVYREDLVFEHLHHQAGKAALDSTYAKRTEREDDQLFIDLEDERWNQAKMLKKHIEMLQGGALNSQRSIIHFLKRLLVPGSKI